MYDDDGDDYEEGMDLGRLADANGLSRDADRGRDMGKIHKFVKQDISSVAPWREKTERLIRERLGERKRSTLYPNAPNMVEPLIDDNIRAKVAQEMSSMFSARQLVNFIPLSKEASMAQRHAEVGFDAMLRLMLGFRSKMEHGLETKMERGFAVLKVVENDKAYGRIMGRKWEQTIEIDPVMGVPVEKMVEVPSPVIPDVEVIDPFDFVVPVTTRRLQDAERITHIHRYTVREYKELAEAGGWKNTAEVLSAAKSSTAENGAHGGHGEGRGYRPQVGLKDVSDDVSRVEVWEVYHYIQGERHRSLLCPVCPGLEIDCLPWIWPDSGEERPWPFVQLRMENRRLEFYDCRGDAEMLLDNQKAATAYMNAKGVQLDFFAKPVFTGPRGAAEGIRWIPGEMLPEGVAAMPMPKIDGVFDYSADIERAKAAKRSGSAQGGYGDTRIGGDKTATQVNAEAMTAQRLTNVSVLRDGEPLAELYQMMWEFLRHNPVELPMVNESREFQGQVSMQIFELPFRVESAASSQQANPDFVLQQLMSLGQFFQSNPYIRQSEFAKILTDQINPQLTNRLVADPQQGGPQGGAPMEQQVAAMNQQVDALTKYVGTMAQADMGEGQETETGGMMQ